MTDAPARSRTLARARNPLAFLDAEIEELKAKAKQAPPGVLVGELVAKGEFELCFQQLPELRQVTGIDFVGPLPDEVQLVTLFTGAVHSKAADAKGAESWLRYLASRDAERAMRKHGMEPASPS